VRILEKYLNASSLHMVNQTRPMIVANPATITCSNSLPNSVVSFEVRNGRAAKITTRLASMVIHTNNKIKVRSVIVLIIYHQTISS
jgi:hypothetical protein